MPTSLETVHEVVTEYMNKFKWKQNGRAAGDDGGRNQGQKAPKKFPETATENGKRKMYVLQSRIINNRAAGECRREQWHCVEKR